MAENRQIVIRELPKGKLSAEHFQIEDAPLPAPAEGEVLVRGLYYQIDAAMRAWMLGPTYRSALTAREVMAGWALAEVVEARAAGFKSGDLVFADMGWRRFAALPSAAVTPMPRIEPLTHLLSVYGVAGLTAYFGLLDIGQAKAGETVVISAAAGAVGSLAGQIAKLKGCRVIGIAGGADKCALLTRDLGFDAAVDYKAGPLYPALAAATQGGADVYFDNVGGEVFEAALFTMKPFGRMVACGVVSAYDADPTKSMTQGVRGVPGWFVSRRLSLRGFIVSDHYGGGRREAALGALRDWVAEGRIKVLEDVLDGFDTLPDALVGLLAGGNTGKRIVKA